jgi:hypothetical protein
MMVDLAKPLYFAVVLWEDAVDIDDQDEKADTILALRAGFIEQHTPHKLVLASEVFQNGDTRDRVAIPAQMVRRVWKTKIFPGKSFRATR